MITIIVYAVILALACAVLVETYVWFVERRPWKPRRQDWRK